MDSEVWIVRRPVGFVTKDREGNSPVTDADVIIVGAGRLSGYSPARSRRWVACMSLVSASRCSASHSRQDGVLGVWSLMSSR
jgi:hypothetical protein